MNYSNGPSSRFQVIARSQLQPPATCYVCGSGNCDDGYLDFGTFVDFHGSFYLCLTCAKQGAEAIGFFSPDEVRTTQALMETLQVTNEALTKELDNARPIIDAVLSIASVHSSAPALDTLMEDASEQRDNDASNDSGQSKGESDAPKPFDRAGRTDVSGAAKRNLTFD